MFFSASGNWDFPSNDGRNSKSNFGAQNTGMIRNRRSSRLSLDEDYDSESPPPKINGTEGVPVKFSVLIFSVRGINEIEQEITIEMRLQIWWQDTRLDEWKGQMDGQKYISITHDIDAKLWHPDIFIDFVKEIIQPELLRAQPASLRYYEDGFLRISTRVTIRMACPMAFHYYPVDQQKCHVDMKSYAYANDVLAIQWYEGKNKLGLFKPGMDLPNFALGLDNPTSPFVNTSSGNFYPQIRFTVLLKRKLSYHLIQTYIPSSLFVIISWLSFLVPVESVPGRMGICMTTLLTQATMFSGIRQSIPKVSYIKALDIWMVGCIFCVFLTLGQYTLLLKLRSLIPKEEARQVRKASGTPQLQNQVDEKTNSGGNNIVEQAPLYNKYEDYIKKCERYTWMLCIILFVLFSIIYWPWLLYSAGYYSKFGEDLFYKVN